MVDSQACQINVNRRMPEKTPAAQGKLRRKNVDTKPGEISNTPVAERPQCLRLIHS